MLALFLGAALLAGVTALRLIFALLRRFRSERYFFAFLFTLLFFEIFNATAFAALLAENLQEQQFFARVLGYLFAGMWPVGAWAAAPLLETASLRRNCKIVLLAFGAALGVLHAQYGLLHVWQLSEHGFLLVLTFSGKICFAAAVIASAVLLSKLEPLLQAVAWRAGKRSRALSATLFLFLLTFIAVCSLSLIYGRLDHVLWLICQVEIALLCVQLAAALRRAPVNALSADARTIALARVLSSSVLIYAGAYCLALGLLVKLAMLLGGSWHLFVSFLAALGAVLLALMLLTGASWRQRWTNFVDRHWRAESYDFRRELYVLIERLANANTQAELAQAICRGTQEIFASAQCGLWLREERGNGLVPFAGEANAVAPVPLVLSAKQTAWLERIGESFFSRQLLLLEKESAAHLEEALRDYVLLTPLQVGPKLLGVLGVGHKSNGQAFREEERRLFDVLAHAAGLALQQAYLQQRVLLTEQSESIYRIASFIAHDLRHAVSTLGLLAHNAKAHLDKPEFRADFLASLSRVTHEMHALVQRLAAVKTGGEATQFAACDAARLLREVVSDAQIAPPIILEMQLEALPQAQWDEEQIRIVLRNLLVNAREAMPQGGTLQVQARCIADHIHFAVRDTGCGMSAEFIRDRLFRPNQTTKAKGLGIGLYQSREIVLAHGGEIFVESEISRGTKFEVVLPCMNVVK